MSSLAAVPDVVARASEAIITIHVRERNRHGQGSGVIVSDDGYALTNAHVVRGARFVWFALKDGRIQNAEVVDVDGRSDLALIRLFTDHLTAVPIGDSESLRAGDEVIAIGAPKGLVQTVTRGIVSLTRCELNGRAFIATDAAVDHGSSGGALLNDRGALIGITSAVTADTSALCLAIPIARAYPLLQRKKVRFNTAGPAVSGLGAFIAWAVYSGGPVAFAKRIAVAAVAVGIAIAMPYFALRRRRRLGRDLKITLRPAKARDDLDITLR